MKKNKTFYIEESLPKRLGKIAKQRKRSLSFLVEEAIEDLIRKEEKR